MGPDTIHSLKEFFVSENDFQEGAKHILKVVRPSWEPENIRFKVFTDGITNKLMGCFLAGTEKHSDYDMVLVRVNGQGSDVIINRKEEQETFRVLSAVKLSPPMYCVFANGMAYGFFHGCPLDEKSVREPKIQRLIAEEMVKLHQVRGPYANSFEGPPPSQYARRAQSFLDTAPTQFEDCEKQKRFKSIIPSKPELQSELDLILQELESLQMEAVFSHNDLLLKNIIFNENKGTIHLIDYEYSFYNYEAYDIANHFAEYAGMDEVNYDLYPSKEEQLTWLRHYLHSKAEATGKSKDSVVDKDVERFYVQTSKCVCASHFFWGIWALIQAQHSTIDFDYISYANIRLTEYFRRKKEFFPLQLPS